MAFTAALPVTSMTAGGTFDLAFPWDTSYCRLILALIPRIAKIGIRLAMSWTVGRSQGLRPRPNIGDLSMKNFYYGRKLQSSVVVSLLAANSLTAHAMPY